MFRAAALDTSGIDRDKRSIPLVLATESPVEVFEPGVGVIEETLTISGMSVPRQVPLVDSHETSSVRNVLGSIRDLEQDEGRLIGRAFFAADPVSTEAFEKFADGHLTDFSVSARREEVEHDDEGNRTVVRSTLIEGSAVVRGADPNARAIPAMRAYADPYALRDETMFDELRAKLIERGLPADADDNQMVAFIVERMAEGSDATERREYADLLRQVQQQLQAEAVAPIPRGADDPDQATIERQRITDISELCRTHNIEDADRQKWIDGGTTVDQVVSEVSRIQLKRLNDIGTGTPTGPGLSIEGGTSEREKFYEAARHGVLTRALGGLDRVSDADKADVGEPAAGHEQFRYRKTVDIAREFLQRAGERVGNVPDHDVIRQALAIRDFVQRASDGPSFHTTGSFSNLFLDAMHKTLRQAYDEAPSTYQMWVRQASSAADFKALHRIVFGEIGLVDEVPENHEYPEQTASDSRENYRVAKHGGIFSITMEMLVNDDMDAMTRVPRMQGNAMRRTINRDAYSVLIDNDTLSDSIALFHATSHGANLDATALAAGAPLDVGYEVMGTQAGLDSTTVLGIVPQFLIVPMALSATAFQITSDNFFPATAATIGLYGPNGPRTLQVISDGQIDNLGTGTNWWLAASTAQIDTVEITFLQGEESPTLDREDGFTTDTIKYKVRQSYALKAIDFRGLYQGNS